MYIEHTDLEIQREPFARPFGFKGSAFHEKWNAVVRVRDSEGIIAFGLGGLAVLWSDPTVFSQHSEVGGNLLQLSVLEYALQWIKNRDFTDPLALFNEILPPTHDYAKSVTQLPSLRLTFTLNALVSLDNAIWMLYAKQNKITDFDKLIPDFCLPSLSSRQNRIAIVPAIGYTFPLSQIKELLEQRIFVLKIKIGQPGNEKDMLAKDSERLKQIHHVCQNYGTNMTDSSKIAYYLDANGRYQTKDGILRLIDYAERIGCIDQIILIEEPYAEHLIVDVSDLPVCLAVDESLHTIKDIQHKAEQGYQAVAIKPAGKTLSLAFQMANASVENAVIPFVADNACVPILVEWNKNISARLPIFPGLKTGMMESNGPQNYAMWPQLISDYPLSDAHWLMPTSGTFQLNQSYYHHSGGIFVDPLPYISSFR